MKILIFNWRDIKNPKAGGSEIYFHEISKRWVEQGNEVTWICGGWKGCDKEEVIDGINIHRVGGEVTVYLKAPLKYLSMKDKYDVILDVQNGLSFCTPLFARPKKFLHIHHIHKDVWFKELGDKGIKGKLVATIGYTFENYLMPLIYCKTPVMSISLSSHNEIEQMGLDCIGIVNPGFSVKDDGENIPKTKHPTVLFLNRIKKYKGIDTLIKAFSIVNKEIPDAELVIAGDGDYLMNAKGLADRLKVNYMFLGRVREEKKSELFKSSWLFVNPSFKEGWGIVNIEANYFGLPVIGSDVGGICDSVFDSLTGELFEYGDYKELSQKIIKLIKYNNLREGYSELAKEWSKDFSWDKASKLYLDFIGGNDGIKE